MYSMFHDLPDLEKNLKEFSENLYIKSINIEHDIIRSKLNP